MRKCFTCIIALVFSNFLFGLSVDKINPFELELSDTKQCENIFIEIKNQGIETNLVDIADKLHVAFEKEIYPFVVLKQKNTLGAISKMFKGAIAIDFELLNIKGKDKLIIKSEKEMLFSNAEVLKKGKTCILSLYDFSFGYDKVSYGCKLSNANFIEKLNTGDVLSIFSDEKEIKNLTSPLQKKNFLKSERNEYYMKRIENLKNVIKNERLEVFYQDEYQYDVLYPILEGFEYDLENGGFWYKTSDGTNVNNKLLDGMYYYSDLKQVEKDGNTFVLLKVPEDYGEWIEEHPVYLSMSFKVKGLKDLNGNIYTEIMEPKINFYYESEQQYMPYRDDLYSYKRLLIDVPF